MSNIIGRTAFRRKGFELHIANLFKLRREHGDDSFFDRNGAIRGYAREYLRDWIPVWQSNDERKEAQGRFDAILKNALGYAHKWDEHEDPEELLYREVLGILQDEYQSYYMSYADQDFTETQMDEIRQTYPLDKTRSWIIDENHDYGNVVFFKKND